MSAPSTKLHVATEATPDAPEATTPPKKKRVVRGMLIDGEMIELCDGRHRPPGDIAPQETDATGVWCRIRGASWFKTDLDATRAWSLFNRSTSVEAAMVEAMPSDAERTS